MDNLIQKASLGLKDGKLVKILQLNSKSGWWKLIIHENGLVFDYHSGFEESDSSLTDKAHRLADTVDWEPMLQEFQTQFEKAEQNLVEFVFMEPEEQCSIKIEEEFDAYSHDSMVNWHDLTDTFIHAIDLKALPDSYKFCLKNHSINGVPVTVRFDGLSEDRVLRMEQLAQISGDVHLVFDNVDETVLYTMKAKAKKTTN